MSNRRFIDIIAGIRLIKLFNLGLVILGKFVNSNNEIAEKAINRAKKSMHMEASNVLFSAVNLLGILTLGAFLLNSGTISLGTLMAIILLQDGMSYMFNTLGTYFPQLQKSLAGASRLFELFDEPAEHDRYYFPETPSLSGKSIIQMQNVCFNYVPGNRVLDDLSMSVQKGQIAALVGHSGSGKSTIFKLLMGFYVPDRGFIVIDGNSSSNQIAYVSQDPQLFYGTVEENIRYGKPDAAFEMIADAAKHAHAHEFILNLPNGYETNIGERGNNLSVGQGQRIAIARALLKDAPILLLDEATSALDSESEQLIQDALMLLMKGRTSIVIAHRLSTVQHADVILVVDRGKVVERGRHMELLEQEGLYRDLYILQFA